MSYNEPKATNTTHGLIVLASDFAGTSSSPTVTSLTGSAGTVTVNGTSTALNWNAGNINLQASATTLVQIGAASTDFVKLGGSTVASTGLIRAANNTNIITARNAGNSADITALGTDGSNNIFVGGGVNDGYVALNASTGNLVKFQINSVDSITISNNTISLPQLTTSYTISQPTQTSDVATNNLTITPQGAFASATGTHQTAGSLVLNVGAPQNGGTTEAGLVFQRGGSTLAIIQPLIGAPTTNWAIYPAGVTPSSSNSCLNANSNFTTFNAGSQVSAQVAGTTVLAVGSSRIQFIQPIGGGFAGAPLAYLSASVTMGTGTVTLSSSASGSPYLKLTGSLTNNNTLALNTTTDGMFYYIDTSGVTFNAHTITIQCNSQNWGTTISASGVWVVFYSSGQGKLFGWTLSA